jgi:hypothetical protein
MSKVTLEKSQERYIVDANGNKTAVILDIELYEQMLEDIHDLAVVAERRSPNHHLSQNEIAQPLNKKAQRDRPTIYTKTRSPNHPIKKAITQSSASLNAITQPLT